MNSILLSNINLDFVVRKLSEEFGFRTSDGFNGWLSYLFQNISLEEQKLDNIFIILDGSSLFLELDIPALENALKRIEKIASSNSGLKIWISDITVKRPTIDDRLSIDELNFEFNYNKLLCELIGKQKNISIFPLTAMIEEMGKTKFYSSKLWYLASMKYSLEGQNAIKSKMSDFINRSLSRKKCLVLDMDNTLWGNVIGEVGWQNIELSDFGLGARYKDFQHNIKEIKDTGVILAVVSKNNHEDAISAFNNEDMVLKQNDFVAIIANWDNKCNNISELAANLNIGISSMVFVDDNPIEREQVKLALPELAVPDFPSDSSSLSSFAKSIYQEYFYNPFPTKEDTAKTQMYQENIERAKIKQNSYDISSYIKTLEIRLKISSVTAATIERVSALSQKTNQFNTTGRRYSVGELKSYIDSDAHKVFVGHVRDKVGDNGLCIVGIFALNSKEAVLENFFMSCRIMNRTIEQTFLQTVFGLLKNNDITRIRAKFVPTGKNTPALSLFNNTLFKKDAAENSFISDLLSLNTSMENLIEVKCEN